MRKCLNKLLSAKFRDVDSIAGLSKKEIEKYHKKLRSNYEEIELSGFDRLTLDPKASEEKKETKKEYNIDKLKKTLEKLVKN